MSDRAKIRLGLIGCGSQGRYLSDAAIDCGEFELVACADVNPQAAESAVEDCGYHRSFTDYRDMLEEVDFDAVILATTHDQLQPAALAAVRAGKHVLVEKPMALNAQQGRQLVEAADEAGVCGMVGYSLRFAAPRRFMKGLVDDGTIGQVRQVFSGHSIGPVGGWLASLEHGGGPLLYIGSHAIDHVLWVMGEDPVEVSAIIDQPFEDEPEREAMLLLHFASGATASVYCAHSIGGRYGSLDVLGTSGWASNPWESNVVTVYSTVRDQYRYTTHVDVPPLSVLPAGAGMRKAKLNAYRYFAAWAAELAEFACAIKENRAPAVTLRDGLRVLKVIDAARRAAGARAAVPVDDAG
ncbi:MAG: Gfo/Idh/MocA family oxidoreductase [Armatimonadetes bacterium]|nr:Gfo/Idh/MocA family oxidoreductase [Armatimonadota bacterium]